MAARRIAPKEDTRVARSAGGLNHYSGLPLLLRDQLRLRPWPQDAPWKAEAEKASRLADHGKWQQAVGSHRSAGPASTAPIRRLVYNRALLGGWLADDRALVAGLHAFAQMDVPLDDAVEAEADRAAARSRSQRAAARFGRCSRTRSTISTRWSSGCSPIKRVQSFEMDPGGCSPSAISRGRGTRTCCSIGRCPNRASDLTRDAVPRLAGVLAIYGRQTDRPERLELTIDKGPAFDATISALKEIAGDALGDMTRRESRRLRLADRAGAQLALASAARYAAGCAPPPDGRRAPRGDRRALADAAAARRSAAKRRAKRPAIPSCAFRSWQPC